MSATFDPMDASSPLAYKPSESALLLLDFQNIIVNMLGDAGKAALSKAKAMREWALANDILVLHSIIDVSIEARHDAKGRERFAGFQDMGKDDAEAVRECAEVAFDTSNGKDEVVVHKQLGFVSGLTPSGATEILHERGIKSLIICGLSTSGAELRTALRASDAGFVVTVVEDACADRLEGLHEMLMQHAFPMTTHVAKAEEVLKQFDRVIQ